MCHVVSSKSANRWPKYAMETNKIQFYCRVSKLLHQDYNMCHGVSSKSANQWPIIRYGINQSVAKYLRPKTTKKTTKKLPAFFYNGSRKVQIIHWKHSLGSGIAQWLERRTRDWKVAGLNPCRSSGRIFFSTVNFLCWLLFSVSDPPPCYRTST